MVYDDPLTAILRLIALSALAADRRQTEHWIEGTPDKPVPTPNGGYSFELNPLIAGRSEMLGPYFDFLRVATQALPDTPGPPLGGPLLTLWAISQALNVVRNNRLAAEQGFPQYWALSYGWRF